MRKGGFAGRLLSILKQLQNMEVKTIMVEMNI